MLGGADDGVDAEHQRGRDQHRAQGVGAGPQAGAAVGGQDAQRQQGGGQAERQVDQEDPVPVQRLGEDSAEDLADRRAGRADEAEGADGTAALARLGEERDEHAEADRGGQGAADALEEAGGDQQLRAGGEGAQQRGRGEQRQAGDEHLPAADEVPEPAGQQEQPGEGDQIGVDGPGQAGGGEAEVLLDGRQGDGDDRAVQDDHQHPRAEHGQGEGA